MVGSPFHRHTRGGVGLADPPRPVGTGVVVELGVLLPEERVVPARYRGLGNVDGSPLRRFDRPGETILGNQKTVPAAAKNPFSLWDRA